MENDEEGCAPPTADVADFEVGTRGENSMPAARRGNRMPKIQDGSGDGDGRDLICWMWMPWDGGGADGNEVVALPS